MTHPLYTGMVFPDYEYREYPKMVYPKGIDAKDDKGKPIPGIVVNNDEEEARVMNTGTPPVREADEIVRLTTLADVKGVQIDKRWGVAKLTAAIEAAGEDPTLDPFK